MDFDEYQKLARKTAVYPSLGDNIAYTALGLNGEAGEVAEKVKKVIRDFDGKITYVMKQKIIKELGDTLWYLSNCCDELGVTFGFVANQNVEKLKKRLAENKIHGEGDDR